MNRNPGRNGLLYGKHWIRKTGAGKSFSEIYSKSGPFVLYTALAVKKSDFFTARAFSFLRRILSQSITVAVAVLLRCISCRFGRCIHRSDRISPSSLCLRRPSSAGSRNASSYPVIRSAVKLPQDSLRAEITGQICVQRFFTRRIVYAAR